MAAKKKAEQKKKGRPGKLTPELQQKIVDAIRMGAYVETAAVYAGISKPTFYDWLKKGSKQKTGQYRDFSNAIEKALAESELRDVTVITQAAKDQWQAAAWRLERKNPNRWGRRKTDDEVEKIRHETERIKAQTEFLKAKIDLLKGATKDTSLLEALIKTLDE